MKFRISRTSMYREEKPIPEAQEDTYTRVDERTFKSAEEHDARFGTFHKWHSTGENHRVTPIGIARDFPNQPCWSIEINSLEDLVELSKKYGQLVLDKDEIEIYDSYRD